MFKRRVALIIIFCIALSLFKTIVIVHAQNQVEFASSISRPKVAPMEEFFATHTISNYTGTDIIIRVTEWLEGASGFFVSEETIMAGQKLQLRGRTFSAIHGVGRHVLRYRVEIRTIDAHEAWVELLSDSHVVDAFIDTGISVSYKTRNGDTAFKGESVEFIAEIRSLSNVPISNIIVEDSKLGIIGEIPLLEIGETETLTNTFVLNETTQSHIILKFRDPLTQSEIVRSFNDAPVRVEISAQLPRISMNLSAEPDKAFIPHPDEVTFDLKIKNTGDIEIRDIEVLNWSGEVFYTIERLMPGQEMFFEYKALIEPEKQYTFVARGQIGDMQQSHETTFIIDISELKPLVEITREVIKEPQPVLRYTIRNIGNVALVDIVLEELEVGTIARLERMEPGDTEQITDNLDLSRDRISNPILIAKEAANMTVYRYQAGEMHIRAGLAEDNPLVTIILNVQPNHLQVPGTVDIECIVRNEGNVALKDVEITLKGRDLIIGRLSEFKPGEQSVFELSDLEIELSQSLTVVASAEDEKGNKYVFESSPVEVSVEQRTPSLGLTQAAEAARGSFLRTILGIIIILAILTAGALIYVMKGSFLPIRRKRRQVG